MAAADEVAAYEPYRQYIEGKTLWRYFASPEETEERLRAAGFSQADAWLEDSPQTFPTEPAFTEFAKTVNLRNHLNALPPEQHADFAHAVADKVRERLGGFVLDYVRLNADARA
jgi:trans-aconitate methyltransferase